jgi:hypothetical protein
MAVEASDTSVLRAAEEFVLALLPGTRPPPWPSLRERPLILAPLALSVRRSRRGVGVHPEQRASWLNWIVCEFTALRYFTLDGSDYPSNAAQEAAIARYVRWANRRARPKQQFAVGSKIRRPDYLPNVA